MSTFSELGINDSLAGRLKERYIEKPTEIQNLVIPLLLKGKNIVFRSETGTGKTFAYLLPALQKLSEYESKKGAFLLICAPTLELCSQIKAEVDFLTEMPSALLIGSVKIERQIENLKKIKPLIIIGNPGRLLNLYKMKKINFQNLKYFVLDEADRLTAQESIDETKELLAIIERSAKKNENFCACACSATVGKKTCAQLGSLYNSAEIIETEGNEILKERIEHWAFFSEKRRKMQTLRSLLSALKIKKSRMKALVFTGRNDEAEKILSQLRYHNLKACGLIGKTNKKAVTGAERKEALDSFKAGNADVLISTDLASRGLDIPLITHVIQMDVPSDPEAYIHRCGRTGRAGKRGVMITIGDETQMRLLSSLEKKLKIRVLPKELYQGKVWGIGIGDQGSGVDV